MIEKALESNKPALEVMYSPDGNYPEGSSYWCYGTLYQVLMLAALNSTLGTNNGLSDTPGFSKTAEYMLYMTGLNSKFFNYSSVLPLLLRHWLRGGLPINTVIHPYYIMS